MEYNSRESNAIVTFYMTMEDVPGVLSSVINHLAEYGANILTINQNIPLDRGGRRHHIDPHDRCDAGRRSSCSSACASCAA